MEWWAGAVIAAGWLVGAIRLLSRPARDRRRALGLSALAAAGAALLHLTLFPPPVALGGETLVVRTAGAPGGARVAAGERLVALPEAAAGPGERVPDLATALRRYPRVERIRVIGAGLPARDREAAAALPVGFAPPPARLGLVALSPPARSTAGAAFPVGGTAAGIARGTAELIDPAGRRSDATAIGADGRFTLLGSARGAGTALFTIRLRDPGRAIVSDTPVLVETVAARPTRVLLLGAPGPEPKYLRRWATDAGMALSSPLDAGGGVRLGDTPVALDVASLRRFDVAVLDDRVWQGLSGASRAALAGALRDGLGLVLRLTAPAGPALRRDWSALGIGFAGGDVAEPVALPPLAIDAPALSTTRGLPAEAAGEGAALDDPAPELARLNVRVGPEQVALLRDDGGAVLAAWRARGAGRLALLAVPDSYTLVLAGQSERYGDWWSALLTTVARAEPVFAPSIPDPVRVGARATLCGLEGRPVARRPDGGETMLLVAPGGCAGFWPVVPGVHTVVRAGPGGGERRFLVRPAGAMPAAARAELSAATRQLAAATPPPRPIWSAGARGPAWPWFLAWLAVSAGLWWLERRRPG